ncbi:MAG: glucose 1-dehydrogenase [Myxococcales bacterium]|nr:glucose 1-dehydrogenase [Myxococcales bacterium]
MNSLFDLTGKTALVTGSTKGIGRSMAKGLAAAGAKVIVTGRKQPDCDAVASDLAAESGGDLIGMACHMGDWDQIDALVERAYAELGKLDVLINNAGINPAPVMLADCTSEYWDKVYDVNLKGPMRLAAKVAPRMGAAGGGSIINITTMGAYHGGPAVGVYTSCKAALHNLTKVMAAEWTGLGVRVNALAPGPFMSEMMKGADRVRPGFADAAGDATLMKRVADCDEVIGSILYLASDASSFVTGIDLKVAGGMSG